MYHKLIGLAVCTLTNNNIVITTQHVEEKVHNFPPNYVQYSHYNVSIALYYTAIQELCTNGDFRLVNGSTSDTSIEGRVEVCANRTWSTVLGSNWGDEEAMVVCRQLGYSDLGMMCVFSQRSRVVLMISLFVLR